MTHISRERLEEDPIDNADLLAPHAPRNVNALHKAEQAAAGFNTRLAVWLTKNVGTMLCAYIFAAIGIGSLVGIFTGNVLLAALCGSVSSYFLQLVLLPILAVGQSVLGHHAELMADEQFTTTQKTYQDIEAVMKHLADQDATMLQILQRLDDGQQNIPPAAEGETL
jgi:hypothetical protein